MTGHFKRKVIEIAVIPAKAAYKYEGCEFCAFHDVEPGICEECEDESEFEPMDDDMSASAQEYLEAA